LLAVAIMGRILRSIVKSDVDNEMETKLLMTRQGGSILCGDYELVGYS
jgi:hypothetical protein